MKTLIIGNVGSGKTTLAKRLSEYFDIPFFSIDSIVHDDENGGIKRKSDEQIKIINNINRKNKEFIIEGVLRDNLDLLLNICDNIIYLDYPKKVTLKRIKIRYLKQRLGILKSDYKVDREMYNNFIKWNRDFDNNKLMNRLSKYSSKLLIIRSNNELKKYFKYLDKNKYYL